MLSSEPASILRVLRRLAILFAPVVCVLAVLEAGLRGMPNTVSVKRAIANRRAARTDVLVLGNSQGLYGIKPRLISPNATSLANVSQSLHYDAGLVNLYLDRMPSLRLVVVSVSYFSLRYRLLQSPNQFRAFFYRRYFGLPEEIPQRDRWHPRHHSFLLTYGIRESFGFLARRFRNDPGIEEDGAWHHAENGVEDGPLTDDAGLIRVRSHDAVMHKESLAPNRAALEEMLGRLRERCIRLVIVTTPVWRTYSAHVNPVPAAELLDTMTSTAARYGAVFRDYQTDTRFTRQDFVDNDHLSAAGADKFTRFLVEEVINPPLPTERVGSGCSAGASLPAR